MLGACAGPSSSGFSAVSALSYAKYKSGHFSPADRVSRGMKTFSFSSTRGTAALLGATAALVFAGCHATTATDPDSPENATSHAFTGTTGDKIGDDYVYYPQYEVYYSQARKEYVYYNGSVWVRSAEPQQIWMKEIRSADSVPMNFKDSPESHHTDVLKMYPRTWKPVAPIAPGEPTRTTNDDVRDGTKKN